MENKKRSLLLSIILFAFAGISIFFGVMIIVFAIGEATSSSTNLPWIITLGAVLCLLGFVCAFFGFYCLKTKKQLVQTDGQDKK